MKTLIVEDDFACRLLLQEHLKKYGICHIAVNGKEALNAFIEALDKKEPYDLICMDINMPEMDGQEALHMIRSEEQKRGILSTDGTKIIMTTGQSDIKNLVNAFSSLCDMYLTKPVHEQKLNKALLELKLINDYK